MSCCAVSCSSRTTKEGVKDPELSFHTFPKCPEIRSEWIIAVRRDNWEPTKHSRLCSKHFEKSHYVPGLSIKRLKSDAVPTIFEGYPSYYQSVTKKRKPPQDRNTSAEDIQITPRKRKRMQEAVNKKVKKTSPMPPTHTKAACRVCLAWGVQLLEIEGPLQQVFENLTRTALHSDDWRPIVACYICHARLKNCHKLMRTAAWADDQLNHILKANSKITQESIFKIDRQASNLCGSLSTFKPDCIDTVPMPVQIKKEEDADSNTGVDNENGNTEMDNETFNVGDIKTEVDGEQYNYNGNTELDNEKCNDEDGNTKMDIVKYNEISDSDVDNVIFNDDDGNAEEDDEQYIDEDDKTELDDGKCNKAAGGNTIADNDTPSEDLNLSQQNYETKMDIEEERDKDFTASIQSGAEKRNLDAPTTQSKLRSKQTPIGEGPHQCLICKRRFKRAGRMTSHYKIHTNVKPYECDSCHYRFREKKTLINHIRTHTGEKPYKCDRCQKQFATQTAIIEHKKIHANVKPFSCHLCPYSCTFRKQWLKHLKNHENTPFKCVICHEGFCRQNDLRRHFKSHKGEKSYECDMCQHKYYTKQTLRRHMMIHLGVKNHKCDVCKKGFLAKRELIVHSRIHTGEKPYQCEICNRGFHRKSNCVEHLQTHTAEKKYNCGMCQIKFARRQALRVHLKCHMSIMNCPYECNTCARHFINKDSLLNHLMTNTNKNHDASEKYECHVCKYHTTDQSQLDIHLKSHVKKPFECEVCGREFVKKAHCEGHMRTHTGEKPYECDICKNKFREKSHLVRHMESHSNEKRYKCSECPRQFCEKSNLDRHLKIHSGVPSYTCAINACQYKCNRYDHLLLHLLTHTGERPFECDVCHSRYKQKAHLTRHKMRKHTVEK